jgi:hypothetical protein
MGVTAHVHSRAQIDQPVEWGYQCSQQIRREHIDREYVRETVDGLDATRFSITNARVVDDRASCLPNAIDLLSDPPRLFDT